jgi:AmiR/NasT family two-component response regulator
VNDEQETIHQLMEAVEHRTVIGIALGIIMERQGLSREAAFERLREVSQRQNRKLYDIACEVCGSSAGA